MGAAEGGPRFTIVSACYNVGRYLDDYIDSMERQKFDLGRVEFIMVDDGSTDDTRARLLAWAQKRPSLVQVISKENGGQSSARNLGIEHATGEWVTFIDPDDMIVPEYLSSVDAFLSRNPNTDLVACNRVFYDEATGERLDNHPLRRHFKRNGKPQLVDLDRYPDFFPGSAPTCFFRTDRIRSLGLSFDERIRPNFEDGHFACMYMLGSPTKLVGYIAAAAYLYRKRADNSSTLQTGLMNPGRFTAVPEYGYLDVLRSGAGSDRYPPEWIQSFVLYELSWYLSPEDAPSGSQSACVGEVAERFNALMPEILHYLDPEVIDAFRVRWFKPIWRDLLLHGWSDEPWHSPEVVVEKHDAERGLVRLAYRFVGAAPREEIISRGLPIQAAHAKTRAVVYFDRTAMHERVLWVTMDGPLAIELDGRRMPIRHGWPDSTLRIVKPFHIQEMFKEDAEPIQPTVREYLERQSRFAIKARLKGPDGGPRPEAADKQRLALRRMAESPQVQQRFKQAWVLVDRLHNSDDSAEHLFTWLRENRPDINAWFVVEEGTPDWQRIKASRHGDRLLAYRSEAWLMAMANCAYLISSHIDVPIHRPPAVLEFTKPKWKFVFLQHGVIKDDLSNWLNSKELSLFVASTPNEYASIAGDGTRYAFTTNEVKLTELPRFDRVREAGRRFPPEKRDLILMAPTWRVWLTPPLKAGSQRRVINDDFHQTDYARNWLGLLTSERVGRIAREQNLRIGFLPHPNLQPILDSMDLPDYVLPLTFEGNDVREFFARAAVMVTDYSSMAFNAAYIDRPVVYFQFDTDRMFGGDHVGRGGYYDYESQGFGPVTFDLDSAEDAVAGILERGRDPEPLYVRRIAATFPFRDGRACERVTAAIEDLAKPLKGAAARTQVPTPAPMDLSAIPEGDPGETSTKNPGESPDEPSGRHGG